MSLLNLQRSLSQQKTLIFFFITISMTASPPSLRHHHLICPCLATVHGHHSCVSSIFPAGPYLYTASLSNEIRVWEQPDLAPSDQFRGGGGGHDHGCSIKAILVVGDRLFAAYQDHKIRVWSRDADRMESNSHSAYKLVATLPSRKDCFLKSLSQKNYVQIRRHHRKLWIEHADTISVLAVAKTQGLLYSGSWDKTVKVWRMSDLKCVESICAHDDAVNALAFSEDSGCLYTGSADGKVKVWRKEPGTRKHNLLATLEGGHEKEAAVNALALSDKCEILFSGGSDGAIAVWGRRKKEQHMSTLLSRIPQCHNLPILCLCATNEAKGLLLSGSADKTVKAWQIKGNTEDDGHGFLSCVGVLEGHRGAVKSVAVTTDDEQMIVGRGGCLVYTGSADKSIKAWWVCSPIEET